jgi:hypothetical protein
MSINSRFVRFAFVVILVGLVEILYIRFAARPFPIAMIIPTLAPLMVVAFVIVPGRRSGKNKV